MIPPLLCAVVVSLTLSLFSFLVVVKRWAFLSVGVSHAAFGGVALGYLAGIPPQLSASAFAVAAGVLISLIKRRGNLHEDVSTGVIFSTFMAVGVILFSLSRGYISDVFSYLFGNMLAVGWRDLYTAVALCAATLAFFAAFRRQILLMVIDEELAYTNGVAVAPLYYSLVTLFTLNVVVSIKLLGVILVSCMTVVPASVAMFFFVRLNRILVGSVIVGAATVAAGMAISFYSDLPPGATTAAVAGTLFFTLMAAKRA